MKLFDENYDSTYSRYHEPKGGKTKPVISERLSYRHSVRYGGPPLQIVQFRV